MSPRLWLLLFVLTLAVGVTVWMSGAKTNTPSAVETVPAPEKKGEPAPVIAPQAVEPEPLAPVSPKKDHNADRNDKRNDSNGLPGPNDSVPRYDTEPDKKTSPAQPPNPDEAYRNAPVDGVPNNNAAGNPPTSYPPPAYPPPVYPDGGFEGDVPPAPGGDPGDGNPNPDGFGDGAPPMEEGF